MDTANVDGQSPAVSTNIDEFVAQRLSPQNLMWDRTAQRQWKLQWKWEKHPYVIIHQPNPNILLYETQPGNETGTRRTVHHAMWRPCAFVARPPEADNNPEIFTCTMSEEAKNY